MKKEKIIKAEMKIKNNDGEERRRKDGAKERKRRKT